MDLCQMSSRARRHWMSYMRARTRDHPGHAGRICVFGNGVDQTELCTSDMFSTCVSIDRDTGCGMCARIQVFVGVLVPLYRGRLGTARVLMYCAHHTQSHQGGPGAGIAPPVVLPPCTVPAYDRRRGKSVLGVRVREISRSRSSERMASW